MDNREALNLPCIVCGRALENATGGPGDEVMNTNQPSEGLAFKSYGHYGGTVFDPMDGHFLEVNICDSCLLEGGDRGVVAIGKNYRNVRDKNDPRVIIGSEPIPREELPDLRLWQGRYDPKDDDEGAVYR